MGPSPEALEQELLSWGFIEYTPSGVALARRLRGALARAAASLQAEETERSAAGGHPLQAALSRAVAGMPLPAGASLTDSHLRFLFAVEWTSLPAGVREALARGP